MYLTLQESCYIKQKYANLGYNNDWSIDDNVENEETEDNYLSDENCDNEFTKEEEENQEYKDYYNDYYYSDSTYDEIGENETFSCENCDKHFYNKQSHDKHLSEHVTCTIDGCVFSAHQGIVDKHIKMQHSSGLYDKIRNISTPEDIKKWIEERKRKYPTKENVEKRRLQQEKMLERGEKLKTGKDRFDRKNKTRLQKPEHKKFNKIRHPENKTKSKQKFLKPKLKNQSLIDDKCDWNGSMFPFRGTASLKVEEEKIHEDFDDSLWIEDQTPVQTLSNKIVLNNALGVLMGAYNSSDESDPEPQEIPKRELDFDIKVPSINEQNKGEKCNSDDEPPVEEKVQREVPEQMISNECNTKNEEKIIAMKKKPKAFKKGNKNMMKRKSQDIAKEVPFLERKFKKRKRTLLEGLLANDIRHERNVVLQCVRYIVENNFFQK